MRQETSYETTLPPVHRALMAMLHDRRARPEERAAIENMSEKELAIALAHEFRFEYIVIRKGTTPDPRRGATCRTCGAIVFWIKRGSSQYFECISIAGEPGECYAPTETTDGLGFSHLADCPQSCYNARYYDGR